MVKLTTNPCNAVFSLWVACENIRFSTLFAAEAETSPAAKSEEKRVFSQASLWAVHYLT